MSRYSSPGTICLLPALLSDLNRQILTPNDASVGWRGPCNVEQGEPRQPAPCTLSFISWDVGTQQKAASTAKVAHVCSWAGAKSISALEGQDFITNLVILTASPVLQTLKYVRLLN